MKRFIYCVGALASCALSATCPTSSPSAYTLKWSTTGGSLYQVMGLIDNTGDLGWITTLTSTAEINLLNTATSLDIPLTLVLRDNTGSFAATNITLTSALLYEAPNGGVIFVGAPSTVTTYSLTLPASQGDLYSVLVNDGTGLLAWLETVTANALQSINTLTVVNQFLTTGTSGTAIGWSIVGTATNQITIPYAGNLGTNNNLFGLITGLDYTNFQNTYTSVLAATAQDTPNTLVKRDNTGSFAATNITATGATIYQAQNGGTISLSAASSVTTYTLVLPAAQATAASQALFNNGFGQLSWASTVTGGGLHSLNTLTVANQYLSTSTLSIVLGWSAVSTATNQLTIPYAGNLGTSSTAVGLITGADYTNFENTYTTVLAATPNDTVSSLVRRDGTGSFVASNITVTSVVFQGQGGALTLTATTLPGNETLVWPTTAPQANQVLFYTSNNQLSWLTTTTAPLLSINNQVATQQYLTTSTAGTALSWTTVSTATTQLNLPYAANLLATNSLGLITGADYTNFENTYTTVLAATPNDVATTLVRRDGTGSFIASNITVTGYIGLQGPSTSAQVVSLAAPSTVSTYTLSLPTSQAPGGYVLANNGFGALGWVTNIATGTNCALPLTTVLRDSTGSFAATTAILSGTTLINYSTSNCSIGSPFIWAPINNNTIIGQGTKSSATPGFFYDSVYGQSAGSGFSSGASYNTLAGSSAGADITAASFVVAVGYRAFVGNASFNITVGAASGTTSAGQYTTIVGAQSGTSLLASATFNTIIGAAAGTGMTTGYCNTLAGSSAGSGITSGYYNVALGYNAQVGNSAYYNVTIGTGGNATTSVPYMTIIGNNSSAALANTGGTNIIVGASAATSLNGGSQNVIVGAGAGTSLIGAFNNTIIGYNAGASVTGSTNLIVGYGAGGALTNGTYNVGIGSTTNINGGSSNNVVLGYGAQVTNISVSQSVVIGYFATVGGSFSTAIGYNVTGGGPYNLTIGANASNSGTNTTIIGNSSTTACYIQGVYNGSGAGNYNLFMSPNAQLYYYLPPSSRRFKQSIEPMAARTEDIINLNPVTFTYKKDETNALQYGLIAEEVEEYYPELITYDTDGAPLTVKYELLPSMLLNEWQKNYAHATVLEKRVAQLKKKIELLTP